MKIQRGIVKYKDRDDIVCTYALMDDGTQYFFLDENDEKKFTNGNRVVTTTLVEAVDPMVKSSHVGVIDGNGATVIPFTNRSIRPVNDNVIVVENANPTEPSVLQAMEMRNDPNQANTLVSTPATIKDRLNAQMGVEGRYIFNDQFSEATVCDINGANLIGGDEYSFISQANDKLYMSKNTVDSPISEFSLTTYEYTPGQAVQAAPVEAAPTAEAAPIDVSTAVVDQQVVEDALNSQATAEVPAEPTAEGTEAVAEGEEKKELIFTYNDSVSTITDTPFEEETTEAVATDGVVATEETPVDAAVPAEVAPVEATTEVATEVTAEAPAEAPVEGVAPDAMDAVAPVDGTTVDFPVAEDENTTTSEFATEAPAATAGEFSTADASISDDLKAFANGFASDEEEQDAVTAEVPETTEEVVAETTEEATEETAEEPVAEETTEEVTAEAEDDNPPVVEEEDKTDEVVAETTEEAAEESVAEETTEEVTAEAEDTHEETFSDIVNATEEETEDKSPVTIDAETVLATVDRNNNGIIDSDEIMVPQRKEEPAPVHNSLLDVYNQKDDDFGYRPVDNYVPTTYDYDPLLAANKKPERTTYSYGNGGQDNIMADVARSMSELMRQNKEQRATITQYQDQVDSLESQTRILQEKFKDQSVRFESLSSKLRSIEDSAGRLESRNQLLESRIRDQEKTIAAQDRELKILRPQVEGKQDLVRLLADARTLLGSESSYGGYESGTDSYYGRRAA